MRGDIMADSGDAAQPPSDEPVNTFMPPCTLAGKSGRRTIGAIAAPPSSLTQCTPPSAIIRRALAMASASLP